MTVLSAQHAEWKKMTMYRGENSDYEKNIHYKDITSIT
jgi:hypothetical protein